MNLSNLRYLKNLIRLAQNNNPLINVHWRSILRRLAIIPARGGSKRIPGKNIKDFCGKPIICHVIDNAKKSGIFDKIHVSTEDKGIATVVSKLGFHPDFMRPSNLADDHTPLVPVLQYVINKYEDLGEEFDQIWLLMACAPLIRPYDLQQASKTMDSSEGKKALLSVCEYPVPIEWAYQLHENGELKPEKPGMFAIRSQDMDKKYFDAGAFVCFPTDMIKNFTGAGSDQVFIGYVLPKALAIDIDDESDWKLAEAMFRTR